MKKMPCLFQRDFTNKRSPVLLRDVTPGCEWALAGEGIATRKRDGTSCAVIEGVLYKRYDAKRGKDGKHPPVPQGAIACDDPDAVTGHWPHWIVVGGEPESRWHNEAWTGLRASDGSRFRPFDVFPDGTYELCGPKLQGNPEGFVEHTFIRHGFEVVGSPGRTWDSLREFLADYSGEGLVFHHPDGRMCKIRRDDFGFAWPIPKVP